MFISGSEQADHSDDEVFTSFQTFVRTIRFDSGADSGTRQEQQTYSQNHSQDKTGFGV
jgi:hypothetical protein